MSNVEQQWTPESGFMTDYIGKITKAYFATDAGYQGGQVLRLAWDMAVLEGDGPSTLTEWWTMGDGWETHDGGKTIVNKDDLADRLRGFRQSTMYYRVLAWAKDAGLAERINAQGGPRAAAGWEGLILRFAQGEYQVGDRTSRETRYRAFPVEVVENQGTLPVSQNSHQDFTKVTAGLPDGLIADLRAAAALPFNKFMDEGMTLAARYDQLGNDGLIGALSSEEFYKSLEVI